MKRVIILDQTSESPLKWRVLFWIPIKATQQFRYANVGAKSAWAGASQAENDAIAAGSIREIGDVCEQAPGVTIGQMGTNLVDRWTALKAAQDADPWGSYYGTFNDDVGGWTVDQSKA